MTGQETSQVRKTKRVKIPNSASHLVSAWHSGIATFLWLPVAACVNKSLLSHTRPWNLTRPWHIQAPLCRCPPPTHTPLFSAPCVALTRSRSHVGNDLLAFRSGQRDQLPGCCYGLTTVKTRRSPISLWWIISCQHLWLTDWLTAVAHTRCVLNAFLFYFLWLYCSHVNDSGLCCTHAVLN